MIDWITCLIPFRHRPIQSGKVLFLDYDDAIQKAIPRRRPVAGSHSQSITVRSCGAAGERLASHISLSGNPSKFLQGHNVFGSDDLLALVSDTVREIDRALHLDIDRFSYRAIDAGEYEVSTIDINYSFELPSQTDVRTWLDQAEVTTRSRCGRPSSRPGTVYWQKHSRRWAMKAYSKWLELQSTKDHRLPLALESSPLLNWVKNILRVELRLKSLELHDLKLTKAKDLAQRIEALFAEYKEKIVMPTQLRLVDEKVHTLPAKLMSTYTLWREGHNVKELLSKPTFYRHRALLLEHGIDISIAALPPESPNVVPLLRVLEATPAQIPGWAFDLGLIHKSAANY